MFSLSSAKLGVAASEGEGGAESQRAEGECVQALNQRARKDEERRPYSSAQNRGNKAASGFFSGLLLMQPQLAPSPSVGGGTVARKHSWR